MLCWGWNEWGQLAAPSGVFTQVSAGHGVSCGVQSDGSVACWGVRAVLLPAAPGGGDGSGSEGSASVPGKVERPSVTVGDGSLEVSWDESSDGGSPIVDYDIRYIESGYIGCADCGPLPWAEWEPSAVSTSRQATITGLDNGTSYAVEVRAKNSVGAGEWSDDEWGTPVAPVTAPGAPRDMVVVAHGDSQLRVSWSPPAGGSAVDHYRVRFGRGPLRGHPVHGDRDRWLSRIYEVKGTVAYSPGLRAGVAYVVTVTAVDAAGVQGPAASASGIVAAPAELTAPRDVLAVAHGERGLRVTWSAPSSTGGSAIDHYLVRYSRGPLRDHPIHSDRDRWFSKVYVVNSTATLVRLLAGVSYTVSVTAVNSAGSHSPAARTTGTTAWPETPPAEEPPGLNRPQITNMEQLKSRNPLDHDDAVRIEWTKVSGATGYEVAYWFRQPYGETIKDDPDTPYWNEEEPDYITVEDFVKRGELVCEEDAHFGSELPCGGVTSRDVSGGDTTEFETKQLAEAKIPARMEVAVRAVNSNTDAKGEWSEYYSLPARKCGRQVDVTSLDNLSKAATVVELLGGRNDALYKSIVKKINRFSLVLDFIDRMWNNCESFQTAVAGFIIDNIPFMRKLLDSFAKTKCSLRQIDLKAKFPSKANPKGSHPAGEPYIMCGLLYDIDHANDKDYSTYRIN